MCLILLCKHWEKYQKKSAMNILIEYQMEEKFPEYEVINTQDRAIL